MDRFIITTGVTLIVFGGLMFAAYAFAMAAFG